MDLIREYWWLVVIVVALVPGVDAAPAAPAGDPDRQRSGPAAHGRDEARRGRGLAGEAAAATSDVTGESSGRRSARKLDGGRSRATISAGSRASDPSSPTRCTRSASPASSRSPARPRPRSSGSIRNSARFAAASPATGSSSRPIISRAATSTASSRGSGSSSRPLRLPLPALCAAGGRRSACRSCARPCRRSRTSSRRGGRSRRSPANA